MTELGTTISVKGWPVCTSGAGTGGSTGSGHAGEPVPFACMVFSRADGGLPAGNEGGYFSCEP